MPRIKIHSSACTGCRLCEMVCSVNKIGKFSSRSSRIWIETDARRGKDVAHVCQQNIKACRASGSEQPRCMAACPVAGEADPPIYWDDSLSIVRLRPRAECLDCLACVSACRFQAIRVDPLNGALVKCSLCEGEPECVTVCVTDAIQYEEEEAAVKADVARQA